MFCFAGGRVNGGRGSVFKTGMDARKNALLLFQGRSLGLEFLDAGFSRADVVTNLFKIFQSFGQNGFVLLDLQIQWIKRRLEPGFDIKAGHFKNPACFADQPVIKLLHHEVFLFSDIDRIVAKLFGGGL